MRILVFSKFFSPTWTSVLGRRPSFFGTLFVNFSILTSCCSIVLIKVTGHLSFSKLALGQENRGSESPLPWVQKAKVLQIFVLAYQAVRKAIYPGKQEMVSTQKAVVVGDGDNLFLL